MEILSLLFSPEVIAATLRMGTSVAFAALGTVVSARAGILNMGQEGQMLICGCVGVICDYIFEDPYIALAFSILAGLVSGLLYGFFAISQYGDHVITGVGFNYFGRGFTALLITVVWGLKGNSETVDGFSNFMTAMEAKGEGPLAVIFGTQNSLFVILMVLMVILWVFIYKTPTGLQLRISGELPDAVESTGGSVYRLQYLSQIIAGICFALAGCSVSLGMAKMFGRNMMAGRGYVALALCTAGRYHPIGAVIAGILFGFTDAMQIRVQGFGIPSEFVQMLPYLFTIIVIAASGRIQGPAHLCKPYKRTK